MISICDMVLDPVLLPHPGGPSQASVLSETVVSESTGHVNLIDIIPYLTVKDGFCNRLSALCNIRMT